MINAEDLVRERVILDDVYQVWECQKVEALNDNPDSVVVFTGKVGPLCKSCGGEMKDFAVRFRRSALDGGHVKEKVIGAIQDQLDE